MVAAFTAVVAGLLQGSGHPAVQKDGADVIQQVGCTARLADERSEIDRRASIDLAVKNGIDDIRPVGDRLRRVDLKLGAEQSLRGSVLRREVAEHAGGVEEIFAHFRGLVLNRAGCAQCCVEAAQNIRHKENRFAQMAEVRA